MWLEGSAWELIYIDVGGLNGFWGGLMLERKEYRGKWVEKLVYLSGV